MLSLFSKSDLGCSWYANQDGVVVRIVMDESHQILTSAEQRPLFNKIHELASIGAQKIYLSATIPVRLEKELKGRVCLPPSTLVLRAPTNRLNHIYAVIKYDRFARKAPKAIADLCAVACKTSMRPGSLGIIFSATNNEVEDVAAAISAMDHQKCHVTHGRMDSSDRAREQAEWLEGHGSRWMSSTTGMIQGIDSPIVALAILRKGVSG